MVSRRTVTLERRAVQGTGLMIIEMHFMGRIVQVEGVGYACFKGKTGNLIQILNDKVFTLAKLRSEAIAQGFTHMRVVGDWTNAVKPKGGKLL